MYDIKESTLPQYNAMPGLLENMFVNNKYTKRILQVIPQNFLPASINAPIKIAAFIAKIF